MLVVCVLLPTVVLAISEDVTDDGGEVAITLLDTAGMAGTDIGAEESNTLGIFLGSEDPILFLFVAGWCDLAREVFEEPGTDEGEA